MTIFQPFSKAVKIMPKFESSAQLNKATILLLESLADILAKGNFAFRKAADELRDFVASDQIFEPEMVKRYAFNLAKIADTVSSAPEVKEDYNLLSQEAKTSKPAEIKQAEVKPAVSKPAEATTSSAPCREKNSESAKLLADLVKQISSMRPTAFAAQAKELMGLMEEKLIPCPEFLAKLLTLATLVRDDTWSERTKIISHIGSVLKDLATTEAEFLRVLSKEEVNLIQTEQVFTKNMEDGLQGINELIAPQDITPQDVAPQELDLDSLCQALSQKVNKLQSHVQAKKEADKARLTALSEESQVVKARLEQSQRDYEDFSRQSREMLEEIEVLKKASLSDPLTGLYNRRAYDAQIAKTIASHQTGTLRTCSIIIFDIDHFRDFNNDYGHLAGDRVLAYVAHMAREVLRSDDLIFRYGGDEFVILLPNSGLDAAVGVAEKVRCHINEVEFKLFKNSDNIVKISLSMGVAEIKADDDEASFLARADDAMYKSKEGGRNQVSICPL